MTRRDRLTAWQDRHDIIAPFIIGPAMLAAVAAFVALLDLAAHLTGVGL